MTRILTTSMYDVRYIMMAYACLTEDDDPGNWRAFLLEGGKICPDKGNGESSSVILLREVPQIIAVDA